jgi:uncharacterized protein YpmB
VPDDEQAQTPFDPTGNPSKYQPVEQPHPETRRERRRKKLIFFIAIGVVAALILAGSLYWFVIKDSGSKQQPQQTSNPKEQTPQVATPVVDATPVSFKSTKFNIEVTYRKDWKFKEASDGEITLTSPQTSYTGSDGEATTGVFTVKVRKGVTESMKATIEKAIASRDSKVIAYTAPTEQQRQYTNVSYAGNNKDSFNFFIVTGSAEFKAGNALAYTLPLDGEYYLVAGGFGTGGSNLSFDAVPKTAIDSGVVEQAIAIAESLKIY